MEIKTGEAPILALNASKALHYGISPNHLYVEDGKIRIRVVMLHISIHSHL